MTQYNSQSELSSGSDPNDTIDDRGPPISYQNSTTAGEKRRRRPSYLPPGNVQPAPPPAPQSSQARPTVHQAVSSAFLSANAQVGNQDLVNTITQQVIQSLRAQGITAPTPTETSPPTNISSVPPRNVITPPSPEKYELPRVDPTATQGGLTGRSLDGVMDDVPLPSPKRPTVRPVSPPTTMRREEVSPRPSGPERVPTDDRTTLEKIWQPLFDGLGKPTDRLGQFLRGLAVHIIEDYEPQHSLVITPKKMLKFYEEVKMADEMHPWNEIFAGRVKHQELSHIYRDLECSHHFVQPGNAGSKPNVPSLTPTGFQTWMTKMILAHPDVEFERFAKAVLNMPISNADNRSERFPKELPRRLFPTNADIQARLDVDSSIYAGALENFREQPRPQQPAAQPPLSSKMPPPQSGSSGPSGSSGQRTSAPAPAPAPVRPARKDTSEPSATSSETDDSLPAAQPIERERKPYYAQPGQGKQFDDADSKSRATREQQPPPSSREHATRPVRAESLPHRTSVPQPVTRPIIPDTLDEYGGVASRARGSSVAGGPPTSMHSRVRSQSRSKYPRSDYTGNPTNVQHEPSSYEDDRRADDRRRARYDDYQQDPRDLRESRTDRDAREYRDSRDVRDSRDYGPPPPRAGYVDDHRRSRVYPDFPPPPPPAYR